MIKICFVCYGNICRSPMAEYIMKDKVNKLGISDKFYITSRATSYEEEDNDIYPPAKKELEDRNIPYSSHKAERLESDDYEKYDYFVCMEDANIKSIKYILNDTEHKIIKLLPKDIADPWYTGNFKKTYEDLDKGIDKLIDKIK